MNFFDVATFAVGITSLACLAVKVACLIWAFVQTQKPATLVYLVFLMVNIVLPAVLGYTISPGDYGAVLLYVGVGSAVIEAGLFIWLVLSLVNLLNRPSDNLPEDVFE